ncbi:DUF5134 domain-containing protein [Kitasatospora sp. NPDC008115]|uniref:DUF5134 domain-containing protein n=1 Tax=Kitasatospora sp. NPDC008115 TaxID=3364022 RepID=UPI0036EC5AA7
MHGPDLVSWLLAVLTAASGGYCLSRLRHAPCSPAEAVPAEGTPTEAARADGPTAARRRHWRDHESDLAEGLMGCGMAVMAVTGTAVPGEVWAWVYGPPAVLLLLAAARRPDRRAHRLHHAVGALAMTYMALVMAAAGPGHSGHHAAADPPALTGALLVYFGGYALWSGSRLLSTDGGTVPVASAGLPRACRLSVVIGMFAMLLTM